MNISNITFIYDIVNDTCFIQKNNQLQELTIKGPIKRNGEANGTWFQIDSKINHWISFRKDRFQANKWEVFYKCVQGEQIKYYRRLFLGVKETLTLAFSKKNKWIKIDGKWRSKF